MSNLDDEIRMAGKADEILNNDAFKAAFSGIEEALLLGIRQSAFKEVELREKLCHRYALLHDLRTQLQSMIDTGKMAEVELRSKSTLGKVKDYFGMV